MLVYYVLCLFVMYYDLWFYLSVMRKICDCFLFENDLMLVQNFVYMFVLKNCSVCLMNTLSGFVRER